MPGYADACGFGVIRRDFFARFQAFGAEGFFIDRNGHGNQPNIVTPHLWRGSPSYGLGRPRNKCGVTEKQWNRPGRWLKASFDPCEQVGAICAGAKTPCQGRLPKRRLSVQGTLYLTNRAVPGAMLLHFDAGKQSFSMRAAISSSVTAMAPSSSAMRPSGAASLAMP